MPSEHRRYPYVLEDQLMRFYDKELKVHGKAFLFFSRHVDDSKPCDQAFQTAVTSIAFYCEEAILGNSKRAIAKGLYFALVSSVKKSGAMRVLLVVTAAISTIIILATTTATVTATAAGIEQKHKRRQKEAKPKQRQQPSRAGESGRRVRRVRRGRRGRRKERKESTVCMERQGKGGWGRCWRW